MNLYRLNIDGQPVNTNTAYTTAQLNGRAAFVAATSNPDAGNYDDVTSIINWSEFGALTGKDSVFNKAEIKAIFDAKGADEAARWAACSNEEKDVVAAVYLVSEALRLERYTPAQDVANFQVLAAVSIDARKARINAAIGGIGQQLTAQTDRSDLYRDTDLLSIDYINVGDTLINDYMHGAGSYAGAGFPSKSYWTQALEDLYTAIVENGNY